MFKYKITGEYIQKLNGFWLEGKCHHIFFEGIVFEVTDNRVYKVFFETNIELKDVPTVVQTTYLTPPRNGYTFFHQNVRLDYIF